MVLPALLVGAEAIRSNVLERKALQALGESMSRTRTYAELETAMFDQSEMVWRHLSGLDPTARNEFKLTGEVVEYWQQRWRGELRPGEMAMADGVAAIQRQIVRVADSIFVLTDAGQRDSAYRLARLELKGPAPARPHRDESRDLPPSPRIERQGRLQPPRGDSQRRGTESRRHHPPRHRGGPRCLLAHLRVDSPGPFASSPGPWRWWAQGRSSIRSPSRPATRSATSPAPSRA